MLKDTKRFDPNGPGIDNGQLYGLPHSREEAEVHIIPVPWDVTVSYRSGTASGPQSILAASLQVELYDPSYEKAWIPGLHLLQISESLSQLNTKTRPIAEQIIQALEQDIQLPNHPTLLQEVNTACTHMLTWVEKTALDSLQAGKLVAVLGGDHSSPLGLMKALSTRHPNFGVLQIDAHMDLRKAYEGFTYSHASIMWNALQIPAISKLIQVGVRDYCQEEMELVKASKQRIIPFPDRVIQGNTFQGRSWAKQVEEMVHLLPQKVYISFDIDGLDPMLCPDTGTPVPGGLGFQEALYLIHQVVLSGRQIIGFDLCEVAPARNEWNAIVGARLLYRLYTAILASQQKLQKDE